MRTSILLLVFFYSLTVYSQNTVSKPMISVMGDAKVTLIPNFVTLNVRIESSAKTASEAKKRNDLTMDAVLKFLKKMKLASKDINTQYLNLYKNYDYNTKEYDFVANQSIKIVLYDLTLYEKLMQGLLESGINRIDGIQFASTELEKHQSEVRKLAIQNAKNKALEYVGALGQTIGKAVYISEMNVQTHPAYDHKMMMTEAVGNNAGIETIAIGELIITAQINVSFELN